MRAAFVCILFTLPITTNAGTVTIPVERYRLQVEGWQEASHQRGGTTHVGGYTRAPHNTAYDYETLLEVPVDWGGLETSSITAARLRFRVHSGTLGEHRSVELYDQDLGSWDPNNVRYSDFNSGPHVSEGWTQSLGSVTVASNPASDWYTIESPELLQLVETWRTRGDAQRDLVLAGNFWHFGYEIAIDGAELELEVAALDVGHRVQEVGADRAEFRVMTGRASMVAVEFSVNGGPSLSQSLDRPANAWRGRLDPLHAAALVPGDRIDYSFRIVSEAGIESQTENFSYVFRGPHVDLESGGELQTVLAHDPAHPVARDSADNPDYVRVVFHGPATSQQMAAILATGASFAQPDSFADDKTVWMVKFPGPVAGLATQLSVEPDFFNVAPLPKQVEFLRASSPLTGPGEPLAAFVGCHDDVNFGLCGTLLLANGATDLVGFRNHYRIRLPESQIESLTQFPELRYAAEINRGEALMEHARAVTGLDDLQGFQPSDFPLVSGVQHTGEDIEMGIHDGEMDITHPDLAGRVVTDTPALSTQHGTSVAGVAGGNGAASSDNRLRGVAPMATLLQGGPFYTFAGELGSVANHSQAHFPVECGSSLASEFEQLIADQRFDDFRNKVIVTAAGNSGMSCEYVLPDPDDCNCGSGSASAWHWGYYSAKYDINPIVVGATCAKVVGGKMHCNQGASTIDANHPESILWELSSLGPTRDGRIKPDLVAPGHNLRVPHGIDKDGNHPPARYRESSGTSYASPFVSGVVALMLQRQRNFLFGCQPGAPCEAFYSHSLRNSAAKAVLVHTARDMVLTRDQADTLESAPRNVDFPRAPDGSIRHNFYGEGPDFSTGWGEVDAERAVDTINPHSLLEFDLTGQEVREYEFFVPLSEPNLRVTMAWDDPTRGRLNECKVSGIPGIRNDVDMYLVDPVGEVHMPWKLDPLLPDHHEIPNERCDEGDHPRDRITPEMVESTVAYRDCVGDDDPGYECFDHRNNVERVDVQSPRNGIWKAVFIARGIVNTQTVSVVSDRELEQPDHYTGMFVAIGRHQQPCPRGYDRISRDLNLSAGGDRVFLCATRDPAVGAPITDVKVVHFDTQMPHFVPAGYEMIPNTDSPVHNANLNEGAGGKVVYLFVSRSAAHGSPIEDFKVNADLDGDLQVAPFPGYSADPLDLSAQSGGIAQYITYRR